MHNTILVVDDNPAGRYATSRTLESAGFKVIESAGGAEALQLARRGVGGVVLDVHLPDLHGFEVCRLLRSQAATEHLPIVHVSAVHVAPEDRVTGLAAGADAYYVSPVEPAVLVATLKALIASREAAESVRRSERRYRGAFDTAPVGMALIDEVGRVADANPALLRLAQLSREALLNRTVGSLVPPDQVVAVEQARAGWKNEPWHGQFPLVTPSGARINTVWHCAPHSEPGWSVATVAPLEDAVSRALRLS